jgi:hypothetical protein
MTNSLVIFQSFMSLIVHNQRRRIESEMCTQFICSLCILGAYYKKWKDKNIDGISDKNMHMTNKIWLFSQHSIVWWSASAYYWQVREFIWQVTKLQRKYNNARIWLNQLPWFKLLNQGHSMHQSRKWNVGPNLYIRSCETINKFKRTIPPSLSVGYVIPLQCPLHFHRAVSAS